MGARIPIGLRDPGDGSHAFRPLSERAALRGSPILGQMREWTLAASARFALQLAQALQELPG